MGSATVFARSAAPLVLGSGLRGFSSPPSPPVASFRVVLFRVVSCRFVLCRVAVLLNCCIGFVNV